MSKNNTTIYECSKCGAQSNKWQGRCLECGSWGTLAEGNPSTSSGNKISATAVPAELTNFSQIIGQSAKRISSNISEVDRVLGGGIVPGSIILLGGEPGIGKSTLLLQIASQITSSIIISNRSERGNPANEVIASSQAPHNYNASVIYNSGEESAEQIKLRFDRLGLKTDKIKYLGATDINQVVATISQHKPSLAVIDSIQTITVPETEATQGGVSQIKAATAKLMELAKGQNIPIIIVGHITKGGDIAGPKTLEHMVDTVLYFEGERLSHYRILRAHKNRFGNTNEIGIFEMTSDGLQEVPNPSAIFLESKSNVSGSVLSCTMEGTRPFLVEVQTLTNPTQFGNPMRKSSGFDLNRLNIIATILSRRAGINCQTNDIILNIVGGIKISDPIADLAVAMSIISSVKDRPVPQNLIALGELGLGGEIRKVNQLDKRLAEAQRMGMKNIISPKTHKNINDVIRLI